LADPELIARVARQLPTDARAVTSTLARARETYAAFRSLRPLPPAELEADLNEQDFGAWTGGTWNALASEAAGFWKDPVETAPPGGESYAAMCRRVHR
jgi:alpha-ribazole phosphatase